jgi:hypothetical protein
MVIKRRVRACAYAIERFSAETKENVHTPAVPVLFKHLKELSFGEIRRVYTTFFVHYFLNCGTREWTVEIYCKLKILVWELNLLEAVRFQRKLFLVNKKCNLEWNYLDRTVQSGREEPFVYILYML